MSGSGGATLSTSSVGGSIVQAVPQLPEAVDEMTNFEVDLGGQWYRVKDELEGIIRTDERWQMATARVHVVVSDRSLRKIGVGAFDLNINLVKVTAPYVKGGRGGN